MASGGGPGAVPAPGGTSGPMWLYFWDKSDDPSREGWWLTKSVGSDDFIVFAPGAHTNVLEAGPWQCGPGQNVEVKTFAASGTGELEVGVYGPGGCPGNGVYQEQRGHPHTSGKGSGRPVYKRIRPLSPDECTPTAPELEAMDRQVQRIRAEAGMPPLRGLSNNAGMLSPDEIMVERATSAMKLTNKTLRDWARRWCTGDREGLPDISMWNTSKVTDKSFLFGVRLDWMYGPEAWKRKWREGCVLTASASSFNDDISAWDTSSVTDMTGMFVGQSRFNQPIGDWRVDKVTVTDAMFSCAKSFNQPLNRWRVDNAKDMHYMFSCASSFNQPLDAWRVDNVTDMSGMFMGASAFNRPLGNWQLRPDCNTEGMFDFGFRNTRPGEESKRTNPIAKRTPTAPKLEAMDRQVQRIRADSALSRQRLGLAGMLSPDEIIAELQSRCGPVGAVAHGAPLSTDQISGEYRLNNCCGLAGGASMTVVPVGPEAIEVWTSNSAFCPCLACFLWQTQGAIVARDAHHFNSFAGIAFSDKGALPPPPGSFVPKVKARRAFRKVKAQDLAGIWCGCNMCGPFIPLWPLSFFPCTKITALDEDNYRTVESGCCLCLPMPPVHSEYRRIYVNGHPTNGFDTYLDGHPANMVGMAEREAAVSAGQARVTYYRDAGCSNGYPGMKRIC